MNGEDSLGLTYEKEIRTNGTTENKHYVSAGGMVFALFTSRTGTLNGLPATTTSYFHKDHLGSIAAITDETGAVTERLAYDPWGKRRFINTTPGLTDKLDALVGIKTDRGYTEHEHLDEMGIINMNGRIFDPLIGRFMSADPFIQAPHNLKSFNRYSYVWNNPLNMFDPTGFESWETDGSVEYSNGTWNGEGQYAEFSAARDAALAKSGGAPPVYYIKPITVVFESPKGGDIYNRTVNVHDPNGNKIGEYEGSIEPDSRRMNCANGCPSIKDGVYPIKAEERGKRGLVLVVGIDGLVPTAAPNPNQNAKSFATGVYIHAGYKRGTEAEGCLTIAPGDWSGFISGFPDGTRGIVRVLP